MSLPIEEFIRNFFNKYFWRQHPETALRYSPVVSEIKKAKLADSKILEIGSGSLGLVPFLKRAIDAVDVDFTGPKTSLLKKTKAQATSLPFRKNSYDVVISVDVLEHLEANLRQKAIFEMLKVAKKLAIIVVPEGNYAQQQDLNLRERWNQIFASPNKYFEEHVRYGLPKKEQILVSIDKSLRKLAKNARIRSYPNLNLNIRYILMRTYITKNKFLYHIYLKGYLLLVPILKHCNFSQCYRRVFVIEFDSLPEGNLGRP